MGLATVPGFDGRDRTDAPALPRRIPDVSVVLRPAPGQGARRPAPYDRSDSAGLTAYRRPALARRFGALFVDWIGCACWSPALFARPAYRTAGPPVLVLIAEYGFFIGLFGSDAGHVAAQAPLRAHPTGARSASRGRCCAACCWRSGAGADHGRPSGRGLHDRARRLDRDRRQRPAGVRSARFRGEPTRRLVVRPSSPTNCGRGFRPHLRGRRGRRRVGTSSARVAGSSRRVPSVGIGPPTACSAGPGPAPARARALAVAGPREGCRCGSPNTGGSWVRVGVAAIRPHALHGAGSGPGAGTSYGPGRPSAAHASGIAPLGRRARR